MKYTADVKLTGYEQITVEADSVEDAEEKIRDRFWCIYRTTPAMDLRQKTTETLFLGETK